MHLMMQTAPHMVTGQRGEHVATKYLRRRGYQIGEKNARFGHSEVDIIAFDPVDQVMVFVEVKSRSEQWEEYRPELNAHELKRRSLRRSARRWVANNDYDGGYRIDLICVARNRVIAHYKELPWVGRAPTLAG